jgi:hypothetical protein
VGLGDQLLATGMARGAKARGKRIAFGDGDRILWDKNSEAIFRDNPNIARPGSERDKDIEWVPYYKGHRIYNRQDPIKQRWIWNADFRPIPGELFFNGAERRNRTRYGKGFILIEPNVEAWKAVAPNKDWGWDNYQAVADWLRGEGYRVGQFRYDKSPVALDGVEQFKSRDFRDAIGVLSQAALYIGPEGGLHHGAAATGVGAVVLFGGFIPPSVTGYEGHANLTGGAEACGNYTRCQHCIDAMRAITVDDVLDAVTERL